MARLTLSFLGPPRIEIDGRAMHLDTRKATALLAYLGVTGEAVSRDFAVTLLWEQYGRSQGQAALRRTLTALRRELPEVCLSTGRDSIELRRCPDVWIDVARVRDLLAQCGGHRHPGLDACPDCLRPLGEAAGLHRGEFLAGFTLKDSIAFDDWQFFLSEDLRLQRVKILDRLALCHAASGDLASALACARRRLDLDPLDETAHAALMLHYAWAGNRAAALRQYDECAGVLRREMECPPGEELTLLRERIRRGEVPEPPRFHPESSGGDAAARVSARAEPAPEERSNGDEPRDLADATVVVARVAERSDSSALGEGKFLKGLGETVAKYRGRLSINPHSNDQAIATFFEPSLAESNLELAVRSALELSEQAEKEQIAVKIGVATGPIGLSPEAKGEGETAPFGRAVVSALRLAEQASPGVVLAAERVYRLTRELFRFGAPSPLAGEPGLTIRVRAFPILGLAPLTRKTRGIEGTRAPLIGRNEELQRLASAYEKSAAGQGQIVVLTGEAGIGKSRLIAELHDSTERQRVAGSLLWLEGRCLAPAVAIGYFPFVDMLRALFARLGPPRTLLEKPACGEALSNEELAAFTSRLDSLTKASSVQTPEERGLAPELLKARTFSAVEHLFRALSSKHTLALIFEDLHWADELSLELIAALMSSLEGTSSLLVCVHRIDPIHKSRNLASTAGRRRPGTLTEIHLREMTDEESARMLDGLLPGLPLGAGVRRRILDRAQGNPYFLEEMVRAVAAKSDPEGEEESAGSSTGMAAEGGGVPERIKAVVLGRYHALPLLQQETLACAAAIGRVFRKHLLSLAMGRDDLESVLDDLEERELLFVERTVPEVEYSFKHVLAQEAIYEELPEATRRGLHLSIARAYESAESGDPKENCEQLARHCDLGGDAERAVDFYFRAGERASRLFANEAAVSYFSRGLELLRGDSRPSDASPGEIDFLIALGVPLVLLRGHFSAEVESLYLRAREIGRESATPDQLFQVTLGLHRLYFSRGEHRKTSEVDEEMIEIGRRLHDPILTSRAHMMLAETMFTMGDYPALLLHAESGYDLYQAKEHPIHLLKFGNDTGVGALLLKAEAEWGLGFPARALETAVSAVNRSREIAHPFTLVFALYMASFVAFMRREPERALRWAEECAETARRERFPLYIGFGPVIQGWALGMLGEVDRGIDVMLEGLDSLPAGLPFRIAYAAMLAELHWKARRFEEALASLEAGFEVVRNSDAHLWEPELNRMRAEIGLDAGEPEVDAERWIQRAFKVARHQASPSLQLRAALALCRLKRRSGGPDAAKARERLAAIYRGFTEGFETEDLTEARMAVDEVGEGS